ncbi:gag-pol polyprotein [Cucumis melo var. makuwa]|uniref:Gag-pol polyprotein n=1 Tax=Cucumis melo var. makuwa TaxID=1194695 RepID=A0A5A7UY92_CUCMM|nr:gag-pol polyprotein [Cucumis melo var. makuwa]
MEIIRERPSALRPPVLDVSKPEFDWTDAEEQASVGNARALNAIFNGVDLNVFKLINSCSTAKKAENKKGKGVTFKSIYEDETTVNQFDKEANMNELIDLLIKQFSSVVKKFKNLNTTRSDAQNLISYQRKDGENDTRKFKREKIDYGRKKRAKEEFSDVENVGELAIIKLNVSRF